MLKLLILGTLILRAASIIVGGSGGPSYSASSSSSSSSEEGYGGGKGHHHHHHGGGGHHHPHKPRPPPAKPKCEKGWYTSERSQGTWCMKVGIAKLDYQGSQALCASMGGVLSGIQNNAERQFIVNSTVKQLVPTGVTIAGVWLGGMRVAGNIFQWTDGNTVGTEGMFWGPSQPDNGLGAGQNCMQLIVMTPAYWSNPDKWIQFPNVIDDFFCHMTHDPPTRLYVCGKRGPPENTIG